jgi:hypothetical protein
MRDRIALSIAHGLLRVHVPTAADDAAAMRAASDARDTRDARDLEDLIRTMGLPILSAEEWDARLRHEPGHAICAEQFGASDIEALIRPDGTGWCSYSEIANPLDAITTHLAGVAAEARAYPPSLRRYANGCHDFLAARVLIDQYNAGGRWPPLTCEAAAAAAVAFVDSKAKEIRALALVLDSAGSLTDYEVRLFSRCAAR